MAGRLQAKVALVTGASSGIGAGVARALAAEGASVGLGARRTDRLEALAEEIRAAGGAALPCTVDVTVRADVEGFVADVLDAFGRVDILVNNAGVMPLSPVAALRVEEWERMVDVNLKGVLYGIAAALPGMLRQGAGHIVNIGSVAGRRPFPGGTVYSATKFAVRSLTAGMQLELSANKGIRVTDIQPGGVESELLDHVADAETRQRFDTAWAGKERLLPEDVAAAVVYAVTAPARVNVNEILIRPTDQTT
ncbi:MAG TPA: SDR family oxidoreductase [Longimicrobiales bacterium]|nr:SDR family oxidoreductase [Longimicrobiales bacterium]